MSGKVKEMEIDCWLGYSVIVDPASDDGSDMFKDLLTYYGDSIGYVSSDLFYEPKYKDEIKFCVVYMVEAHAELIPYYVKSSDESIKKYFTVINSTFDPEVHNFVLSVMNKNSLDRGGHLCIEEIN